LAYWGHPFFALHQGGALGVFREAANIFLGCNLPL
jgi:hypothetical protein